MALPGNKDFNEYANYVTAPNPTTSAQAQDYFRNQAELLKAVIDCDFWQPETVYQPGDVVKSDSMPNGTEAVMVATKASVTSNVEPQWGAVGGANISDGACFWKLRWKHWSKEVASVDEMKNGTSNDKLVTPKLARLGQTATNRLPNTAYSVGNVVYVDSNLSIALKCTTDGTTSNTELDISNKVVGGSVKDGSVVWSVIARSNVLDEGGVASYEELKSEIRFNSESIVSNADLDNFKITGRYNAYLTAVAKTLLNNPLSDVTTGIVLEVFAGANTANVFQILYSTLTNDVYTRRYSGSWNDWKKVSVTPEDFLAKGTIHITEMYKESTAWYVKYSNSWVEQGASVAYNSGANAWVGFTLPVPMADGKYSVVITDTITSNGTPSYSSAGNYNNNTSTKVYLKANGSNRQINYRVCGWGAE